MIRNLFGYCVIPFLLIQTVSGQDTVSLKEPYILVLGTAQDAGYPQAGCEKECCARVINNPTLKRNVVSLALVDPSSNKWWLFEATPDITLQLQLFRQLTHQQYAFLPAAVFVTHGHIGHYTGLMYFGREAMNTSGLPVFTMPRMRQFLQNNGPWSQLCSLHNIELRELTADTVISLSGGLTVAPFLVPHRDEFTETVGFKISDRQNQVLFIPDIDKWGRFNRDILTMIRSCRMALLDGTFYRDGEVGGRAMSLIPHPFVSETMELAQLLSATDKRKIVFIHFNHTNPLLDSASAAYKQVLENGFSVAEQAMYIRFR